MEIKLEDPQFYNAGRILFFDYFANRQLKVNELLNYSFVDGVPDIYLQLISRGIKEDDIITNIQGEFDITLILTFD